MYGRDRVAYKAKEEACRKVFLEKSEAVGIVLPARLLNCLASELLSFEEFLETAPKEFLKIPNLGKLSLEIVVKLQNAYKPKPTVRPDTRIVCSAMLYASGVLIVSPRHYDPVCHTQINRLKAANLHGMVAGKPTQGFIDQFGNFYDRFEALKIATEAGQLVGRVKTNPQDRLFSEDLY